MGQGVRTRWAHWGLPLSPKDPRIHAPAQTQPKGAELLPLCLPQGLKLSLGRTESIPSRGRCQAAQPHADVSKPWPRAWAGSASREETDLSHRRPKLEQTNGGKRPLRSLERRQQYQTSAKQEGPGRGRQWDPRSEVRPAPSASALR